MGAPQSIYTGGLLRATVRYFDTDRTRPGLPPDVAALVDKLGADSAGIQLVNLNPGETRNLIVQAGAFAEHEFARTDLGRPDRPGGVEVLRGAAPSRGIRPARRGHAPLRPPADLRLPLARGRDPGAVPVAKGIR